MEKGEEMADDEVEELLKAAQDEITLKLSINSHTSRSSNLDPDLHSRFLALKSLNNNNKDPKPTNSKVVKDEDDLMLRFAALKNTTLPSSSSCSDSRPPDQIGEDDDEVEKLIQWAIDAARLDPSPPSDDDDDDDDHSDNDSDDDSTKDVKP